MLQKRWRQSPIGTILEPEINDFEAPTDASHQNQEDVMHYQQAVAQDVAYNHNAELTEAYTAHFNNDWLVNYQAGRQIGPRGQGDPEAVPPTPPNGVKVRVSKNEDGSIGYEFPQIGPQVCPVPTYTKIPMPQNPAALGWKV